MTLSTATLEKLPSIENLRRLTKSLAMLDTIICPEWEYRYYSFNSRWGSGEEMASMRNGCGDDWFLLFDQFGAALKGFAHEYPLASDNSYAAEIQKVVPVCFSSFLHEPAFSMTSATFCLWRRYSHTEWNVVVPPSGRLSPEQDGSAELLGILNQNPETYREWAENYFELKIPLAAVGAIYNHQPLNQELVSMLNPDLSLLSASADADEIGYPAKTTS